MHPFHPRSLGSAIPPPAPGGFSPLLIPGMGFWGGAGGQAVSKKDFLPHLLLVWEG